MNNKRFTDSKTIAVVEKAFYIAMVIGLSLLLSGSINTLLAK